MDLTISSSPRKEIKEGAGILTQKVLKYRPKIAAFNGKGSCSSMKCAAITIIISVSVLQYHLSSGPPY